MDSPLSTAESAIPLLPTPIVSVPASEPPCAALIEPPIAAPPLPAAEPLAPPLASVEAAKPAGLIATLRESPPWLVSMVLHFVILTCLAQIFLPETRLQQMVVMFAAQSANPDVEELVISVPAIVAPAAIDGEQQPVKSAPAAGTMEAVEEALSIPTPQEALAAKANAPVAVAADSVAVVPAPQQTLSEEIEESAAAAAATAAANRTSTEVDHNLAKAALAGQQHWVADNEERIVYHFILWDIGKLNDDTAPSVRQDFNALQADALPALVRGLNASAYIHASCPVGVLSYKVENILRESKNPEHLRYAIENIGRGVPASAPHASRLAEMKKRLLAANNLAKADDDLKKGKREEYVKKLQKATIDKLTAALGDEEPDIRWAAARAIGDRKVMVPIPLTNLLADENEDVRRQAHLSLVTLANGNDFGKEDTDRWRNWWYTRRTTRLANRDPIEEESRARWQLGRADALRDQGYVESAKEGYRAIVHRLPGTEVAETARQRISDLE